MAGHFFLNSPAIYVCKPVASETWKLCTRKQK